MAEELREQPSLLFSMFILFFYVLLDSKYVTVSVTLLPNGLSKCVTPSVTLFHNPLRLLRM